MIVTEVEEDDLGVSDLGPPALLPLVWFTTTARWSTCTWRVVEEAYAAAGNPCCSRQAAARFPPAGAATGTPSRHNDRDVRVVEPLKH